MAGNGSGETIAIVDAYNDPSIQTNLNTFDSQYGLPATTVAVVNETGGTTYPPSDSTGGWELEESLDVEWAHATAPGASIMLVESSSTNNSDLLAAVKYASAHANVVSIAGVAASFRERRRTTPSILTRPVLRSWRPRATPCRAGVISGEFAQCSRGGRHRLDPGRGSVWASETSWIDSGGGPSADEATIVPARRGDTDVDAGATPDVRL